MSMGRCTVIAIAAMLAAPVAAVPGQAPAAMPAAAGDTIGDLPLTVLAPRGEPGDAMVMMVTGDGGWAALDRTVGDSMAAHGLPVVGLNAHHYFSTQRTPDGASRDLERVLRHYLALWGRDRVVLIGYSRGAETLPFMISRLPPDLLARVAVIALIGPAPNANFKFHLVDLFEDKHRKDDLMTVPEIEKLRGREVLCFYGKDEKESACRALPAGVATVVELPGGHHFGGSYAEIANRILAAASQTASR